MGEAGVDRPTLQWVASTSQTRGRISQEGSGLSGFVRAVLRGIRRRIYPPPLCGVAENEQLDSPELLECCRSHLTALDAPEWGEDAPDEEEADEEAEDAEEVHKESDEGQVTEEEKRSAEKLHVNLGGTLRGPAF